MVRLPRSEERHSHCARRDDEGTGDDARRLPGDWPARCEQDGARRQVRLLYSIRAGVRIWTESRCAPRAQSGGGLWTELFYGDSRATWVEITERESPG